MLNLLKTKLFYQVSFAVATCAVILVLAALYHIFDWMAGKYETAFYPRR